MARIKESERLQKRDTIIAAAVRVFAQKGFFGAKVTDVAHEAGVADGTIYLYFKNKDDLLICLFEEKMEEILTRFRIALDKLTDPVDKLTTFIHTHFAMIQEDMDLADVFQVELRQSSKFLKDYRNEKFVDYLNMIASILQEGQQKGCFREDIDIDIQRLLIFGAIDEIARQWILGADAKYSLQQAREQAVSGLVHGLLKKE